MISCGTVFAHLAQSATVGSPSVPGPNTTASSPMWGVASPASTTNWSIAIVGRRIDNHRLRLRPDTSPDRLRQAVDGAAARPLPPPLVTPEAVAGLKFGDVLPPHLAVSTLAARLSDPASATEILTSPVRWEASG